MWLLARKDRRVVVLASEELASTARGRRSRIGRMAADPPDAGSLHHHPRRGGGRARTVAAGGDQGPSPADPPGPAHCMEGAAARPGEVRPPGMTRGRSAARSELAPEATVGPYAPRFPECTEQREQQSRADPIPESRLRGERRRAESIPPNDVGRRRSAPSAGASLRPV